MLNGKFSGLMTISFPQSLKRKKVEPLLPIGFRKCIDSD